MSSGGEASSPTSSSPVSWQTLFWTLLPLATNVMTQPSGRVLSQKSRYRTYLRSVPIICALDALAFLVRVFVTPFMLPVSLHAALEITIKERYKDHGDESEALKSLEKQTWLRWVFFIVGTLGPSIKLMSMTGVDWTRAWGAMFIFAFLTTEASALCARRSFSGSVMSHLPLIASLQVMARTQVAQRFETFEGRVFFAGIACHFLVLIWSFFDLFRSLDWFREDGESLSTVILVMELVGVSSIVHVVLALAFFFFILAQDIPRLYRERHFRPDEYYYGIRIAGIVATSPLVVSGVFFRIGYEETKVSLIFTLSLWSTPLFALAVKAVCRWSPKLGETLLVASNEMAEDSPSMDSNAVYALTLCIANIAICVLWYWLRFDPEGTSNPSWTSIFG